MNYHVPPEECEIIVSKSGGAGGQNVNKLNTKITLHWNVLLSPSLIDDVKKRFLDKYKNKISDKGIVTIISQTHRTQKLNLDEAYRKLNVMIDDIFLPPIERRKTKPTKSSKTKRLNTKKMHGNLKKMRREKF
jgi:ribosome-associated protein